MKKPTDINDLHVERDLEEVKTCIDGATKPEPAEAVEKAEDEKPKCPTQSQVLMCIARDQCDLYHCEGEAYATTPAGATFAVRAKGFRMFLSQRFVGASGRAPSSQALHEAIDTIEAVVVGGDAERTVALRTGEEAGKVYVDLGTDDYQLVEVDRNGWRIVAHAVPALRFRRPPSMRPLPVPTRSGSLDDLRSLLNMDDDGWRLAMPWLLYSLQPRGPFPILVFAGEQGTAKTTASKIVRSLVDPSQAAVRSAPKDDDQLFVGVRGSWVLAYDNLSGMPAWLSDCLCGLATGTAQSKRQLYTDGEEVIIQAFRPVIVNGIDDMATRPDFASRALSITLSVIPDDQRREESDLWADFEAAKPGVFGALLTVLAQVMVIRREIHLTELPRMADFARFGVAVEGVLGWPDGSFLEAYESSQRASATTTMESNLVALAVQKLMTNNVMNIMETATDLLPRLAGLMTADQVHSRQWPTSPNQLGNQLRRAAPALRRLGISISRDKVHGDRLWQLTRDVGHLGAPSEIKVPPENIEKNRHGGTGGTWGTLPLPEPKKKEERGGEEAQGGVRDRTDTKEKRVPLGAPGAPLADALDPLAPLGHCLRVRPGTAAPDADKQALAEHFRGLNGTATDAGVRLFTYWKATPVPTVGEFLAREPRAKGGAA